MAQDSMKKVDDLKEIVARFDPSNFATLKGILEKEPGVPGWFMTFATKYAAAAVYALAPLTPPQIRGFLDLYCGDGAAGTFTSEFTKKLDPADSDWTIIGACVAAAVAAIPHYVTNSLTKDKRTGALSEAMKTVESHITLPATGTSVLGGWTTVGTVRYPVGFASGTWATDLHCLYHVRHETGPNPSKAKLTRYFAECVTACAAAKDEFVAARNTALAAHQVPPAVTVFGGTRPG